MEMLVRKIVHPAQDNYLATHSCLIMFSFFSSHNSALCLPHRPL